MSGRVLVCRECGEPLQIVCPTHGSTVSVIGLEPPPPPPPPNAPRPNSVRHRIWMAVSDNPRHPSTSTEVAARTGLDRRHVNVEISFLCRQAKLLERVAYGKYVRVDAQGGAS